MKGRLGWVIGGNTNLLHPQGACCQDSGHWDAHWDYSPRAELPLEPGPWAVVLGEKWSRAVQTGLSFGHLRAGGGGTRHLIRKGRRQPGWAGISGRGRVSKGNSWEGAGRGGREREEVTENRRIVVGPGVLAVPPGACVFLALSECSVSIFFISYGHPCVVLSCLSSLWR